MEHFGAEEHGVRKRKVLRLQYMPAKLAREQMKTNEEIRGTIPLIFPNLQVSAGEQTSNERGDRSRVRWTAAVVEAITQFT